MFIGIFGMSAFNWNALSNGQTFDQNSLDVCMQGIGIFPFNLTIVTDYTIFSKDY